MATGELLDLEKRAELETKWGRIVAVDCGGLVVAFRCPAKADMDRFHTRMKRKDDEAPERLMRECCVDGIEDLAKFLDENPFAGGELFLTFKGAFGDKSTIASPEEIPSDAAGDLFLDFYGQLIGVKKPARANAKRFQAEVTSDNHKAEETLARSLVTFSQPVPFELWAEGNPFAFAELANEIVKLGGFGTVGKI